MLNYKNNNLVDVKKITLFSVFLFVLSSCANKIPLNSFEQEVSKPAPNYSNIDHWAAHPDKSDYSDLKPKNLLNDTLSLDSVDVFFVYPTLYFDGLEESFSITVKCPITFPLYLFALLIFSHPHDKL